MFLYGRGLPRSIRDGKKTTSTFKTVLVAQLFVETIKP
jgi:hypothetical protein